MKNMVLLVMALLVFALGMNAGAEQAQAVWYALDEEESVITVTLPVDLEAGCEWSFEISDPEALELVTMEVIGDEEEEKAQGVEGNWVGSFKGTFEKAGDVDLKLTLTRGEEKEVLETRILHLFVVENNQLQVVSEETVTPEAQSAGC